MKPVLLLAAALAPLIATPARADSDLAIARAARPVHFGGRFGLNMAKLGGDDVADERVKSRAGFFVGGFATIRLGPNVALEPSLGYSQKGFAERSAPGSDGGAVGKFDYLAAPVVAVGLISVHPQVNLRGLAGGTLGVLLSAKVKENGRTADLGDQTSLLDLGLVVGAGVDVALPSALLVFDLRYEHGLTSVDDTSADQDIHHRVFSASGGVAF